MNRKMVFLAVVIFSVSLVLGSGYCLENWKNMGLYGGMIEEVVCDTTSAYMRVESPAGIYKAPIGSGGWQMLNGTTSARALGITQDNGYIYMNTTGSMYYSADGGVSWNEISAIQDGNGIQVNDSTNRIYTAARDGNGKNIFYSDDHGTTWSRILSTPLSITNVNDISVSANDTYVWAVLDIGGDTLYRFIYSGGTWTGGSVAVGATPSRVTIDPNSSDTVYIVSGFNLYKSTNATAGTPTFSAITSPGGVGKVYITSDSSAVYKSQYKSTNGGTSWSSLPEPVDGLHVNNVLYIHPSDNNKIFAQTDQGLAYSANAGATMTEIDDGLQAVNINGGIQDPANPDSLYIVSKPGIARTTDGGTTWTYLVHGAPWTSMAVDPAGTYKWAGGNGGDVHINTGSGSSFGETSPSETSCRTVMEDEIGSGCALKMCVDPVTPTSKIYVAIANSAYSAGGLYVGTRTGTNWAFASNAAFGLTRPVISVYAFASGGNTIILVGCGNKQRVGTDDLKGMWRSTDGGTPWTKVVTGYTVQNIIRDGTTGNLFAATGHADSNQYGDGTVLMSTDNGVTWTNVQPNTGSLGAFTSVAIDPNDPTKVYASCRNIIYASANSGTAGSWYEHYIGYSGDSYSSLFMFEGLTTVSAMSAINKRYASKGIHTRDTADASLSLGATAGLYSYGASTTWYLAEGCTAYGYDEWILIENPGTSTAEVTVTFYKGDGTTARVINSYTGTTRNTIHVNTVSGLESTDVSAKIVSTNNVPIIVERAMYKNNMATGADTIGVTNLSNIWYFAEGCTADSFNEWILLMNPQSTDAHVTLTYMLDDGTTVLENTTVTHNSRKTITVNSAVPNKSAVSVKIDSDLEIAAERSMERNDVMHVSIGTTAPSSKWYFAEGCTKDFATYICIQNPSSTAVACTVTFNAWNKDSPYDSKTVQMTQSVGANSRSTIHVNNLKDSNGDYYFPHHDVATCVDAGMSQVIAESSLYWGDNWTEGHATIGSKTLGTIWYFAEGCTRAPFDMWILLQNPTSSAATVTITYAVPSGQGSSKEETYTVAANSRSSIHVDTIQGLESVDVSATISSNIPIAAERAMYFNEGGHCSIGLKG